MKRTHVVHQVLLAEVVDLSRGLDTRRTATTDDEAQQFAAFLWGRRWQRRSLEVVWKWSNSSVVLREGSHVSHTNDALPNRLCITNSLQLETMLQPRHAVCA